jgi:hypothetical protein
MLTKSGTALGRRSALPGHPALTYPWNDARKSARRHILAFLAIARECGLDTSALERLLDASAERVQELRETVRPTDRSTTP